MGRRRKGLIRRLAKKISQIGKRKIPREMGRLYGGLKKSWKGYRAAVYQGDKKRAVKYAMLIQHFQDELGLEVTDEFKYIPEGILEYAWREVSSGEDLDKAAEAAAMAWEEQEFEAEAAFGKPYRLIPPKKKDKDKD